MSSGQPTAPAIRPGKRTREPAAAQDEQQQDLTEEKVPQLISVTETFSDHDLDNHRFGSLLEVAHSIHECTSLPLDVTKMISAYSEDFSSWILASSFIVSESSHNSVSTPGQAKEKHVRRPGSDTDLLAWLPLNNAALLHIPSSDCDLIDQLIVFHLDTQQSMQLTYQYRISKQSLGFGPRSPQVCELPNGLIAVGYAREIRIFSAHNPNPISILQLSVTTVPGDEVFEAPDPSRYRIRKLFAMGNSHQPALLIGACKQYSECPYEARQEIIMHCILPIPLPSPSNPPAAMNPVTACHFHDGYVECLPISPTRFVVTTEVDVKRRGWSGNTKISTFEFGSADPLFKAKHPGDPKSSTRLPFGPAHGESFTVYDSGLYRAKDGTRTLNFPAGTSYHGIVHFCQEYCILALKPRSDVDQQSPSLLLLQVAFPNCDGRIIGSCNLNLPSLRNYDSKSERIVESLWIAGHVREKQRNLSFERWVPGSLSHAEEYPTIL